MANRPSPILALPVHPVLLAKGRSVSSSRVKVFGAAAARCCQWTAMAGNKRCQALNALPSHHSHNTARDKPPRLIQIACSAADSLSALPSPFTLSSPARACTVAHTSSIGRERAASAQPSSTIIDRLRETRFRFRVSMRATAELATQYGHQNTAVPGPL